MWQGLKFRLLAGKPAGGPAPELTPFPTFHFLIEPRQRMPQYRGVGAQAIKEGAVVKKWIRTVLVVLVAVLVAAVVFAQFFLGSTLKAAVNTLGPKLTKTAVTLEDVKFSLLTGNMQIKGLVVGNPEGFRTRNAIKLGRFQLKLKPLSLFSKVLVIERILIEAPEITYEMGSGDSNLARLQKNLAGEPKPDGGGPGAEQRPPERPTPPPKGKKAGQKVQIDDLRLENGKVYLSATLLQGARATMSLPPIHITDIGKDTGGVSTSEAVALILASVTDSVTGKKK
jgi:uncharacterized protein involved in outer membrane biogenesis